MTEALSSGDATQVRHILESNGLYEAGITFVSDLWNQAVATLQDLPEELVAKQNLQAISQLLREKLDELEQSRLTA